MTEKLTQLKARAEAAPKAAVAAKPLPKVTGQYSRKTKMQNGKPCLAPPTTDLKVTEVGVSDQLPGDKEANEILISHAAKDLKDNASKTPSKHNKRNGHLGLSIVEKVLKKSEAQVEKALDVQDNFHQASGNTFGTQPGRCIVARDR